MFSSQKHQSVRSEVLWLIFFALHLGYSYQHSISERVKSTVRLLRHVKTDWFGLTANYPFGFDLSAPHVSSVFSFTSIGVTDCTSCK
jgi:hypothetical protein